MSNPVSIADAKNNLPRLIHEAEEGGAIELTRRGKPVAVIVSMAQYRKLRNCHKITSQNPYACRCMKYGGRAGYPGEV